MSTKSLTFRVACDLPETERRLLEALADGQTMKSIRMKGDRKPYVTLKTIEYHRQRLQQRTDLHSLPELTKLALRLGLAQIDV